MILGSTYSEIYWDNMYLHSCLNYITHSEISFTYIGITVKFMIPRVKCVNSKPSSSHPIVAIHLAWQLDHPKTYLFTPIA
jgi:hypothetical protein